MKGVQIRLARQDEVDSVIELVKPMWVTHGTREPEVLNEDYLKRYDAKKYFESCFTNQERNRLYIAIDGDLIIGCCRIEIIDLEGMFNEKKALYVDDLVVRRSHQRKGIGKRLIEEAENFARSQNIKLLKNRVYSFNTEAQNLFEKQGFRSVYSEQFKVLGDK